MRCIDRGKYQPAMGACAVTEREIRRLDILVIVYRVVS